MKKHDWLTFISGIGGALYVFTGDEIDTIREPGLKVRLLAIAAKKTWDSGAVLGVEYA